MTIKEMVELIGAVVMIIGCITIPAVLLFLWRVDVLTKHNKRVDELMEKTKNKYEAKKNNQV
jgi:hypothetical protein